MTRARSWLSVGWGLAVLFSGIPIAVQAADDGSAARQHAEQSVEVLKQTDLSGKPKNDGRAGVTVSENNGRYSSDQYLIGKGEGDLSKGRNVCQRVSELSARTDLAKQIRVMVKEHMVDRVRERSGRESDQDIELTREEIVQEYLQGVKIVDRQFDEANKTCSATAVMSKSQIQPKPALDHPEPSPAVAR